MLLPETLFVVGFAVPPIVTPPASKPVTDSLNVTVKWIVAALVGSLCVAAFAIDALGLVVSSVIESVAVAERFPASSLYWTHTLLEPSPEASVKLGLAL